ncbi:Hypothetical predicted protein [Marmota monax]|uniref:Uncharacterized protein n=1 Tax=Marmota monax TaxID=9995 RepID=A0A5E4BD95_MARMO|nr:hypothetical protein GHT09_003713 [Marmota monax]VTJ67538.1 Hypothetical predicted protein [Marmota monax]
MAPQPPSHAASPLVPAEKKQGSGEVVEWQLDGLKHRNQEPPLLSGPAIAHGLEGPGGPDPQHGGEPG